MPSDDTIDSNAPDTSSQSEAQLFNEMEQAMVEAMAEQNKGDEPAEGEKSEDPTGAQSAEPSSSSSEEAAQPDGTETPSTEPSADDEPDDDTPDADAKPSEERQEESKRGTLAAGYAKLKRKTRQLEERAADVEQREAKLQQLEQHAARLSPMIDRIDQSMRVGDTHTALGVVAQLLGRDPNQFALDLIGANLGSDQPEQKPQQLDPAKLREQILDDIRKEQREREQRAAQQRVADFISEAEATIEEHQTTYPALAAMPAYKRANELQAAIAWAASNKPDLLKSPTRFVKLLDEQAKEEFTQQQQAFVALTGNGKPDSKPEAPAGQPKRRTAAEKPRTTQTQTTSNGGASELSEDEDPVEAMRRVFEAAAAQQ